MKKFLLSASILLALPVLGVEPNIWKKNNPTLEDYAVMEKELDGMRARSENYLSNTRDDYNQKMDIYYYGKQKAKIAIEKEKMKAEAAKKAEASVQDKKEEGLSARKSKEELDSNLDLRARNLGVSNEDLGLNTKDEQDKRLINIKAGFNHFLENFADVLEFPRMFLSFEGLIYTTYSSYPELAENIEKKFNQIKVHYIKNNTDRTEFSFEQIASLKNLLEQGLSFPVTLSKMIDPYIKYIKDLETSEKERFSGDSRDYNINRIELKNKANCQAKLIHDFFKKIWESVENKNNE